MEIKTHPKWDAYEFNTDGQYRMIGNQDWLTGSSTGKYCSGTLRSKNGEKKTLSIHRGMWETFKGEIEKGNEIDHINGNKKDNRLENLRSVDLNQNRKFAQKEGHKLREISPKAHKMKRLIKGTNIESKESKYFDSKTKAGKYYGCSPALVYLICEGKNNSKTFGGNIKFEYSADKEVELTHMIHGRKGKKYGKYKKEKKVVENEKV